MPRFRAYKMQEGRVGVTHEVPTGRIAIGRILLGGLVAGLICNLSGMAMGAFVLADDFRAVIARLQHPPTPLEMFAQHIGMRFLLGVLVVWLYAAIQPRFKPGWWTALRAAGFLFLAAYGLPALMLLELEIYSPRTTVIALGWGLVEITVMALAGAACLLLD